MCPKGDDPFTYFSDYRAIIISLNVYSAAPTGSFKLTYDALAVSIPTTGWTDELCQEAFQALPAFKTVRCSLSFSTTRYGGFTLQVEFIEFEPIPYQNNIYYHEGNPPRSSFKCDTTGITTTGAVSCGITDVVFNALPGNLFLILLNISLYSCSFNLRCLSIYPLLQSMRTAQTEAPVTRPLACVSATLISSPPIAAPSRTACALWTH